MGNTVRNKRRPTTRGMRQRSILTVHNRKLYEFRRNPTRETTLRRFVASKGIRRFIRDWFLGGVDLYTRHEVLNEFHHNVPLRRWLSALWRREVPHSHEWIPCTANSMIVTKAVNAGDFRYIRLASAMNSPTSDIFFEPKLSKEPVDVVGNGLQTKSYHILNAHPNVLRFAGGRLVNPREYLAEGSPEFHTGLVTIIRKASSPEDLVERMRLHHWERCWAGQYPTAHKVTQQELWRSYTLGRFTSLGPHNLEQEVAAAFDRVQAQFDGWLVIARGQKHVSMTD